MPHHYDSCTDSTKSMRHWCFTLNNYTDEEVDQFKAFTCRYIVFGFEVGEVCGTPHLQGYIELDSNKRLSAMKKINARAHWGIRYANSTRERARDYCKKGEQTKDEWDQYHEVGPNWGLNAIVFTAGDWESGGAGKRTDILAVKRDIEANLPMIDIIGNNFELYSKHRNAIKDYKALIDKKNSKAFRKLTVSVYWGVAESNKTRSVLDNYPDTFRCQNWTASKGFMFDGYEGEDVILIDDFYGDIPFEYLLNILDGHHLPLNIKNGRTYARYTKVFITSNKDPALWYPDYQSSTRQYTRRLTEIKEFK